MKEKSKHFQPKDIVVGQKYKHANYLGAVYIGVGLPRSMWNDKRYIKKYLMVIKSDENSITDELDVRFREAG